MSCNRHTAITPKHAVHCENLCVVYCVQERWNSPKHVTLIYFLFCRWIEHLNCLSQAHASSITLGRVGRHS